MLFRSLVLDDTRDIAIPSGATSIDTTFTVNVGSDPDFTKYLNTIKSYDITGVTLIVESYSGPTTTLNGTVTFGTSSVGLTNWELKTGSEKVLSFTTADLVAIGEKFQANGSETLKVKGTLSNSTSGTLKLHTKVNLKIKVI